MFKSKVYSKRRAELRNKFESGILLFIGNNESQILVRDTAQKFRQNANFLYYWGLNEPGLVAIIDVKKNQEILFGHDLTTEEIVWEGIQPMLKEKAARIGVVHTAEIKTLKRTLLNYRKGRNTIHYLPQHSASNILRISDLLNKDITQVKNDHSLKFVKAVIVQRSKKMKKEIVEIEKALEISYSTHTSAMKKTKPGKYEYDIVKNMEKVLIAKNSRWAYIPIFTVDGERLHNHHYGNRMLEGQLVINDSGCEAPDSLYSSDITRTFPVNGKFSKKQKRIYEIVLRAQLKAIAIMKPGTKFYKVHMVAAQVITKGLVKIGLMKGDVVKAVELGAHTLFFPHGLGHLLGIDVHDMEDLGEDYVGYDESTKRSNQFGTAYLRFGKELNEGFVLTVEPGIYFIPQLIEQWEKEKKFIEFIDYEKVKGYIGFGGVRIEDNVLVTKFGSRILGKPIPKTIREIEKLMKN
jgi:Xaa-Pro aminopeptidase